jgi:8-oxo-dGTP pyrophosphatase MutT (NUDIX family)
MRVAQVEHIHTAAKAGDPPCSVDEVAACAGVGLSGDRYAEGQGYWRDARVSRDLTLVEAEVVEKLTVEHGIALKPGEMRRNLTTRGVRLNDLVGRFFWVGQVLCRGTSLCEPCRHLEELTGKPLLRPLVHRSGLRADLLTSGWIRVGDSIEHVEEQPGVGVVVLRDGEVLLGQRLAAHGHGSWSLPGGKPRPGESPSACALRELYEETGLVASRTHLIGETLDGFPESRLLFRTSFVHVEDPVGRPTRREPRKTDTWSWHDWDDLPAPLFTPVASLVESGYRPEQA